MRLPASIHHAELCAASTGRRVAILPPVSAKSNGLSFWLRFMTVLTLPSFRLRGNEFTAAVGSITAEQQQAAGEV